MGKAYTGNCYQRWPFLDVWHACNNKPNITLKYAFQPVWVNIGRKRHGIVTFTLCFVWLCIQQTVAIHSDYISEIPTNLDTMIHEVKNSCDECG